MNKLTNTLRATALTLATAFVAFASGCASTAVFDTKVLADNMNKPFYVRVNEVLDYKAANKFMCDPKSKDFYFGSFCNNDDAKVQLAAGIIYTTPGSFMNSGNLVIPHDVPLKKGDIVKVRGPVVVTGTNNAGEFRFVEVAARADDKERAKSCYFDSGWYWKGIKCDGWDTFKDGAWLMDAWSMPKPTEAELKQRDAQKG